MAFLSIPSRWLRVPTYAVRMREDYARDLGVMVTPYDLKGIIPMSYSGSVCRTSRREGIGWYFYASSSPTIISADTSATKTNGYDNMSFVSHFYLNGASGDGNHNLIGCTTTASYAVNRIWVRDSDSKFLAEAYGGSGSSGRADGGTVAAGNTYVGGGTFRGQSNRKAYLNGVASATETTAISSNAALTVVSIGPQYTGSISMLSNVVIHYAGWWKRAFDDAEMQELGRYPYLWAVPDRRVVYFGASAAVGGSFQAAWASNANQVIQPGAMQ